MSAEITLTSIMVDFIEILSDDTYLSNNIIILVLSIVIYLLFWLFHSLTNCFSAHAKHVASEEIVNKYGGISEDNTVDPEKGLLSDEAIVYDYLHKTYWSKKYKTLHPRKQKITETSFRPTLRHFNKQRDIHIIYSKKTLWRLAFSEKLESGLNEKFAFIFKGLKSWSVEETQGRFSDVMEDLLEFRQV